jgi:hypothetical protein
LPLQPDINFNLFLIDRSQLNFDLLACIAACCLANLLLFNPNNVTQVTTAFVPVGHKTFSTRLAQAADGSNNNIAGPPYSGPAVKPILDSIDSPADMKRLDMRQLKQASSVVVDQSQIIINRVLVNNTYLYEGLPPNLPAYLFLFFPVFLYSWPMKFDGKFWSPCPRRVDT